jgi:hypothetical protein
MRPVQALRMGVGLGFVSFATAAFFFPSAFDGVHARAQANAIWMVLSLVASACAAKLTVPVAFFGLRAEVAAPIFLLLALPYFVRLLIFDIVARALASRLSSSAAPRVAPRSRAAVALAAAARARR